MRYEILEKLDQFFSVKEHLERLDEGLKQLKDERKSSLETLERLTDELKDVLKKGERMLTPNLLFIFMLCVAAVALIYTK